MVCSGNLDRTSFTNSTKCSEYPLATSRQMNFTCGTASKMRLIFSRSFCPLPELTATCYGKVKHRRWSWMAEFKGRPSSIRQPSRFTLSKHGGCVQETNSSRGKGDLLLPWSTKTSGFLAHPWLTPILKAGTQQQNLPENTFRNIQDLVLSFYSVSSSLLCRTLCCAATDANVS